MLFSLSLLARSLYFLLKLDLFLFQYYSPRAKGSSKCITQKMLLCYIIIIIIIIFLCLTFFYKIGLEFIQVHHTFSQPLTTGIHTHREQIYCSESCKASKIYRSRGKEKEIICQEDMAMFAKDDLKATELTLGLPGCARGNKRALPNDTSEEPKSTNNTTSPDTKKFSNDRENAPPTK